MEESRKEFRNTFLEGLKDGVPIGLGYISVSFTFGIMAVANGLPVWAAVLISMTTVTSAGQFAALPLLLVPGAFFEIAVSQFVINLRYALMSLSLSQKLGPTMRMVDRFIISFVNTDEVFAVASSKGVDLSRQYLYGLIIMPYFGWGLGTFMGAAVSSILPPIVQASLGIAVYGMFLAIIIPPSKRVKPVLEVVIIAGVLGCIFYFTPVLNNVSSGFAIIICAVLAAGYAAFRHPIEPKEGESES